MNPNHIALFDNNELNTLRETHKKIRNKMLEIRYQPFVEEALLFYAAVIRINHRYIMDDLKNEMNIVPNAKEFWSKTSSFYSYRYNLGARRLDISEEKFGDNKRGYAPMYCIWSYTNFRNRLLEELRLDPKVFSFKLSSRHVRDVDVGVSEYYNTIMLIYRP